MFARAREESSEDTNVEFFYLTRRSTYVDVREVRSSQPREPALFMPLVLSFTLRVVAVEYREVLGGIKFPPRCSRTKTGKVPKGLSLGRRILPRRGSAVYRRLFVPLHPSLSSSTSLARSFARRHPSRAFSSPAERRNRVAVLRAGKNEVTVRNECKYSRFRIELSPWEFANLIRPPGPDLRSARPNFLPNALLDARTDPGRN